MTRTTAVGLLSLALVLPAAAPAEAAPRPLRGAYTTGVTLPDPTTGGVPSDTCEGLPTSRHRRALTVPSAGTLRVELASVGDWGLALRDRRGRVLRRADAVLAGGTERLALRVRARASLQVESCNFAGAPTARVSWVFTPAQGR